jgi:Icc-related predicted phosphoesterase
MADMNKVLLLGDVHGSTGWLKVAVRVAQELDVRCILQLGDFGFWPHYGSGKEFLRDANQLLNDADLFLWWVDGNHENHDWLADMTRDEGGFWHLDRIVHIGRGARWEWEGRTFLGCGGAYSIDKYYRREGESWWAGETITEADLRRCEGPSVDVLVTHDAPWGAANVMGPATVGDKDDYPESAANRRRVAALCDMVTPNLLVHGHYHHRNSTLYKGTMVEGFGRDTDYNGSMGLLHLDTLLVDTVRPGTLQSSSRAVPVDDNF